MGAALCAGLPIFALLDRGFSIPLVILGYPFPPIPFQLHLTVPFVSSSPGIIFGLVSGGLATTTSLLSSDLFPPKIRHRSVGLAYNAAICLFGGLGPAWVELARPSLSLAGGYFLLLTSAASAIAFQAVGVTFLPKVDPTD